MEKIHAQAVMSSIMNLPTDYLLANLYPQSPVNPSPKFCVNMMVKVAMTTMNMVTPWYLIGLSSDFLSVFLTEIAITMHNVVL